MNSKLIFENAKSYLLTFPGIINILESQITFDDNNCPKSIPDLFIKMLEHAQNRGGMPNSIGKITDLKEPLFDFSPDKVLMNYTNGDVFSGIQKSNCPASKRMVKLSGDDNKHWVSFSNSIYSIAEYLSKFPSIDNFNSYVGSFKTSEPDTLLSFALLLGQEIKGYGFALACDFIKEHISPDFVKPDVHIKDIFVGLGISEQKSSDFQIFRDVIKFSKEIDEVPFTVDKVFWLIGSGNFHSHGIKIATKKNDFIKTLKSGGSYP